MWELYEDLIAPIPEDIYVDEIIAGIHWTMVRVGKKIGIAATNRIETIPSTNEKTFTWKKAAELIKSWNLIEASIGLAAINAFYNNEEMLQKQMEEYHRMKKLPHEDIFMLHKEVLSKKKIATIGHFYFTDIYRQENENFFVLERNPNKGDYPDSACEFILPQMDYVFITGCTLVNKTLPRILELSKQAKTILVGPSVPAADCLLSYGIDEIGSTFFTDIKKVRECLQWGQGRIMAREGSCYCFKRLEEKTTNFYNFR